MNRHYLIVNRRLRSGTAAVKAAPHATNAVVLYVEASIRPRGSAPGTRTRSRAPLTTRSGSRTGTAGRIRAAAGGSSPEEGRGSSRSRRSGRPADAVLDYVWSLPRGESNFLTVVLPELFERPSLVSAVARKRTTFSLKLRLLSEPGIVVTNVPLASHDAEPLPTACGRARARVGGSRLVGPRRQLRPDARAPGHEEPSSSPSTRTRRSGSSETGSGGARRPARDRRGALPRPRRSAPRYLRELTTDPDVAVSVVMPELVFNGMRKVLHNQRALYIKRLLLFEPRVFLSSVPYHLP